MNDELFEAARAVRDYLTELIPGRAAELDSRLGILLDLGRTDPHGAEAGLEELFAAQPAVRDWVGELLTDPELRPPDIAAHDAAEAVKAFSALPGPEQRPSPATRYICPEAGERVWYRRSAGQPVPRCPEHDIELVPAPMAAA